jgi:hypothetical protein
MSQDTFPFVEGEDDAPFAEEGERNRKAVLIAGGVAAALVLGAAGWFFLGGSSDSSTDSALVPTHQVRPAVVAPKKAAVKPVKKLPAAYKAQLGRDPFKALYVVPAATTTAPVGTVPTTTPGSPAPTTVNGSTGTSAPVAARYPLKLVSISKPSPEVRFFTWTVDAKKTVVIPAQRFGKLGELVVLAYTRNAAGTATGAIIQVGDDSPIDVAIGESVSVL